MKIYTFLFRPNEQQIETARKWLALSQLDFEVYSLPTNKPEDVITEPRNAILISFGIVSVNLVDKFANNNNIQHVQLPALAELMPLKENEAAREHAKSTIEKLSVLVDNKPKAIHQINTDELPTLTTQQMLALAKQLAKDQTTSYITFSYNHKVVQVGGEREDKTDIHISPLELIQIGILKETLKIKQIELKGKDNV